MTNTEADNPTDLPIPDFHEQIVELGRETVGHVRCENPFMTAEKVNVHYGDNHAIRDVTLEIAKNQVIALIGPSGCGKSTFLRCLNRMNDTIETARVGGKILLDGKDIYRKEQDPVALRARVGMVFQKPIRFRRAFTTTSPMVRAFMASLMIEPSWTILCIPVWSAPAC